VRTNNRLENVFLGDSFPSLCNQICAFSAGTELCAFAALKLEDEYLIQWHLVVVSMSVRPYANSERRDPGMEVQTDLAVATVHVVSNPFPLES
jgi:hypothetical protein